MPYAKWSSSASPCATGEYDPIAARGRVANTMPGEMEPDIACSTIAYSRNAADPSSGSPKRAKHTPRLGKPVRDAAAQARRIARRAIIVHPDIASKATKVP